MNVSILQENLLRALARTSRILTSKTRLPVLQNLLLFTEDGQLRITAANLETTESVWAGAKIDKEGGLCVPARLFTELVMTLPADTVRLVVKEGSLVVSCGKTQATVAGTPATEFPQPSTKKQKGSGIEKDAFVGALSLVLYAAAADEGRPLLTGAKLTSIEDGVQVAATDGYRLSVKTVKLSIRQNLDLVVPARALSEVVKVAIEEKEAVSVEFAQNPDGQLVFRVGDTEVVTRAIDGQYPSFEKIIPKTYTTRAHLGRDELARAVKSASVFARDNANIVRLSINNQVLTIDARSAQAGGNRVEVAAQIDGDGGEIAFNSRFLLEFLANFPEEELLFEMTGSLNPGVFRPVKDASFLHIIMPVRVSSGES